MRYPTNNLRSGQINSKEAIAADIAGRETDTTMSAPNKPSQAMQDAASGMAAGGANGGGNAMTRPRTQTVTGTDTVTLPNGVSASPNGGQIMYNGSYVGSNAMYAPSGAQSYEATPGTGLNYAANGGIISYGNPLTASGGPLPLSGGALGGAASQAAQRAASMQLPGGPMYSPNGGTLVQPIQPGYSTQIPGGPTVTPNGAAVTAPGISYTPAGGGSVPLSGAAQQAAQQQAAQDAGLVQLRAYADSLGMGNLVGWDDGTKSALFGGMNVPYKYISDGRAYVDKATIDALIDQYKRNTNSDSPTGITDRVMDRHQSAIDRALDRVVSRDRWSYDPQTDPAYQAYAREYARNAEKAYNRAMGSGGLYSAPTSHQIYQAIAGYGDQMQALSDRVPTLAQQDYQRYSDEQTRNRAALEALQSERNADLNARYTAQMAQLAQQRAADETDYARREDNLYNYPAKGIAKDISREQLTQQAAASRRAMNEAAKSDYDAQLYPEFANAQLSLAQAQTTAQVFANTMTLIEITERDGAMAGRYKPYYMEQLGIQPDPAKAGTQYYDSLGYPLPGTQAAREQLNAWNIVGKLQLLDQWRINNGMG